MEGRGGGKEQDKGLCVRHIVDKRPLTPRDLSTTSVVFVRAFKVNLIVMERTLIIANGNKFMSN